MELVQAEDKAKLKRDKTKQAIALALEGRWEEAVEVNREILYFFPNDAEALNRMGKAQMELGNYAEAEDTFRKAVQIAPHNTIAKKNLERVTQLRETAPAPQQARKVTVQQFIEETGRSGLTALQPLAPRSVLAKLAAGDVIRLNLRGNALMAETADGIMLGQVEPKLGLRLARLISGGNRYEGVVTSVKDNQVTVLLKETYQHPSQAGIPSFPSSGDYSSYLRDSLVTYELDEADEDEESGELSLDWKDDETEDADEADESVDNEEFAGPTDEEEEE